MSRQIIQVLRSASARPLPRLHSLRCPAPFGTVPWVPATSFCWPVAPARSASGSTKNDFDIDEPLPSPSKPPSSPSKPTPPPPSKPTPPPPNPYPESLLDVPATGTDWSRSYAGLSTEPFPKDVAEILMAPVDPMDVEIKPGSYESRDPRPRFSVNHHLSHRWAYIPSGD